MLETLVTYSVCMFNRQTNDQAFEGVTLATVQYGQIEY